MNENGTMSSSPCCISILLKSMESPWTLAGVPVLNFLSGSPSSIRLSLRYGAFGCPIGPDGKFTSPMYILPLRNTPAQSMTASARYWQNCFVLTPFTLLFSCISETASSITRSRFGVFSMTFFISTWYLTLSA